jgi:SAM-dependent methyltransferase
MMDAKRMHMEQVRQERRESAPPQPPDIAALAQVVVGESLESGDSRPAIIEFFKRAGFNFAFVTKLLENRAHASAPHVIKLAALQLHLERTGFWDDASRNAVRHLERQLARALTPSEFQNYDSEFSVPLRFRKGRYRTDQVAAVDAAQKEIRIPAQELGVPDLSEKAVLDIGCGVKFSQAFYGRGVPVRQYHGVDVDGAMIEFLASNVNNEKFSFKHIDVYNEMYNKRGEPLSAETDIGAAGRQFDLICLFSVFTHLNPKDYMAMLELARRYISPNGALIYTAIIDEKISGKFEDAIAEHPMLKATYTSDAIREMLAASKWNPTRFFRQGSAKDWIVCEPC